MKFNDKELDTILEALENYGYENGTLEHTIIMNKKCDKIADKIHKYFNDKLAMKLKP